MFVDRQSHNQIVASNSHTVRCCHKMRAIALKQLYEQKSKKLGFGETPAIGMFRLLSLHTYITHRLASSAYTQRNSAKPVLCCRIRTKVAHGHDCKLISKKSWEALSTKNLSTYILASSHYLWGEMACLAEPALPVI